MESWKMKKPLGHRSKANAPCKKHPRHKQSPGVCSICLNEKLSQLSNPKGNAKTARSQLSSSSSSSYVSSMSSSNVSSCSSPVVSVDSDAMKSIRVFKKATQSVLKKSRSMAFVPRRRKEIEDDDQNGNKIAGFWSKLLPRKRGLMHSRTIRERVITAVH